MLKPHVLLIKSYRSAEALRHPGAVVSCQWSAASDLRPAEPAADPLTSSDLSSELPQSIHDSRHIIVLEQTDGGDSGGSGFQTGFSSLQSHATQGQDRDPGLACFAELNQSCGLNSGGAFFLKHRSEDRKGCAAGFRSPYFFW